MSAEGKANASRRGDGGRAMRRVGRRAGGAGADQAQVAMEMGTFDLDGEVDSLRQKVGRMKRLAGDIGDESRLQGELLANLDATLQKARQGVKRGLRKMDKAFKQVNSKLWTRRLRPQFKSTRWTCRS